MLAYGQAICLVLLWIAESDERPPKHEMKGGDGKWGPAEIVGCFGVNEWNCTSMMIS